MMTRIADARKAYSAAVDNMQAFGGKPIMYEQRARRKNKPKCELETVYGYSLYKSVVFVAISSMIISLSTFVTSIVSLVMMTTNKYPLYNSAPYAANLILGFIFCPMSLYQMIISFLLFWQAIKLHGNIYLCYVWFASHMSILPIYLVLFLLKSAACFAHGKYLVGVVTTVALLFYEALFIFFCIVVHSYKEALDKEIFI